MSDSDEERRFDSDSEEDHRRYMDHSIEEEKPKEYCYYQIQEKICCPNEKN